MQNATISLYVTLLPPNSHSEPACPRHAGTANISQQGFCEDHNRAKANLCCRLAIFRTRLL